jgi:uncharacterized protein DUF5946
MDEATEECIGCGAVVPWITGPVHRYMTSAPGCWAMYGELAAHFFSDVGWGEEERQNCADTFAVQHSGTPGPQAIQSVGGHLVGLYARLELGLTVDRAREVMRRGIIAKGFFRWLTPPSFRNTHTVAFMLAHQNDPARSREWAASAWQAWAAQHKQVRAWYETLARDHRPASSG